MLSNTISNKSFLI